MTLAPGIGYSSDTQQLVNQQCYDAISTMAESPSNVMKLETALSFHDFENEVSASVDVSGGFGMFSFGGGFSYLHSMREKDYSLSLNYYEMSSATVSMQFKGPGPENMLTSYGYNFYANATNPYFGILCGDNIITSYQAGAMLLMGINIAFSSNYQKEQFTASAGGSFADIFGASSQISQLSQSLGIEGSVSLQAYQIGGEPEKLASILSNDPNGGFYVLTCSLQAMSNCVSAADGLLSYAKNDFSAQFSFQNQTNITPLWMQYSPPQPIEMYGLIPPASLVTQEVQEARMQIADIYKENDYYQQKLFELINGYPVSWETQSAVYGNITALYQQVQDNIQTILSPGNSNLGAMGCYNLPQNCVDIVSNIIANTEPIQKPQLLILEGIKYKFPYVDLFTGFAFYKAGDDNLWKDLAFPSDSDDHLVGVNSYSISDTSFTMATSFLSGDMTFYSWMKLSSTDSINYSGNLGDNPGQHQYSYSTSKTVSEFYFEPYNSTMGELVDEA